MDSPRERVEQKLILQDRKTLTLDGVENILDFTEEYLNLKTNMGMLSIEGVDLKIESLSKDTGAVLITGCINALYFKEGDTKKSFLSRFFG